MDASTLGLIDQSPLVGGAALISMALVPVALLGVSSFVKLHVVFTILRNALGAQQVPSGAVIGLLSLALTAHIMGPIAEDCLLAGEEAYAEQIEGRDKNKTASIFELKEVLVQSSKPLTDFLRIHASVRERMYFASMRNNTEKSKSNEAEIVEKLDCVPESLIACEIPGEGVFSLVSAFLITELQEAFAIGFMIFLPFLVVDLVVANLLVGLGMMMVSPVVVSLPFKILLFVACDGWFLLSQSLVKSYLQMG